MSRFCRNRTLNDQKDKNVNTKQIIKKYGWDPRGGWKKGVKFRRTRRVYEILDNGKYISSPSKALWYFSVKGLNGEVFKTYPMVQDEIIEE